MKPADGKTGGDPTPEAKVMADVWKSSERMVRRTFPGPRGATALLRVAVERAAYAELIAHAKESLDKEICGVLAGVVCEDDSGPFLHVAAVIRGSAASHGSTHVTFTQETWNQIHRTLDEEYPKLQMIGWYHSHPGFGVEFSEMDLFIQKNFFPSPTQAALVIDPMSGAVAICINTGTGIQYLERFWVDGREQPCQVPKANQPANAVEAVGGSPEAMQTVETRVGQLIQAVDDLRASYHRFLFFVGTAVCFGVVVCVAYTYYSAYRYRNEPPQVNQIVPIPVQIGDRTVVLGVGITSWNVPEELNAVSLAVERERRIEEEKAAREKTNKPATNTTNTTNAVSTTNSPKNQP